MFFGSRDFAFQFASPDREVKVIGRGSGIFLLKERIPSFLRAGNDILF